ncbi:hypothetical protein PG593_03635 [Riemerella anatipestifer]|nr:hypothetical protein [Riemerella anatipestifer]MDY3538086.1 hypothetical protein [Riemerella anatipestifer]
MENTQQSLEQENKLPKVTIQDFDKLLELGKTLNHSLAVDVAINMVPQEVYSKVNWKDLTATSEEVKKEVLEYINTNETDISNFLNTKNNLIKEQTKKNFPIFDYLKNQIKYLGFGESEEMHKTLEEGINSTADNFKIKINSDKASEGNSVNFVLNFSKSNQGGVFFNSYNATLTNEKEQVFSHTFSANNGVTAKEAINLLEGRAVKTELNKTIEKIDEDTGEIYSEKTKEPVFIKLKLAEEKNEFGNFKMEIYSKNYGIDTAKILDKSDVLIQSQEQKDFLIKSLEKGNIVPMKIKQGSNNPIDIKAILNPQYKTLNIYDNNMNRLNTNKPLQGLEQDNSHEKNNVRQQNISRGI